MEIMNIDNNNFDLNSIFQVNLTCNFEILKKALESLILVQKIQAQKINKLEEKLLHNKINISK